MWGKKNEAYQGFCTNRKVFLNCAKIITRVSVFTVSQESQIL